MMIRSAFSRIADGGGRRVEGVAVGAFGDERDDGDAVAADLFDDVAQRGDGGDDEELVVVDLGGATGDGRESKEEGNEQQSGASHPVRVWGSGCCCNRLQVEPPSR